MKQQSSYYSRYSQANRSYLRVCQDCEKHFLGYWNAQFCPDCLLSHHQKNWQKRYYETKGRQHLREKGLPCPKCGQIMDYRANQCISCYRKQLHLTGKQSFHWKGGMRKEGANGYTIILLERDNPFYAMANKNGYVREHRLIMAKHLNRSLTPNDIVHHINGRKSDNRIKNMVVVSRNNHPSQTLLKIAQKRIRELESKLNQVIAQTPFPDFIK